MNKVILIFVALHSTLVLGYLTEQSQAHLKKIAQKSLNSGESMDELAQSGQIITYFGDIDKSQKNQACKKAAKFDNSGDKINAEFVLAQAEVFRIFECPTLKEEVESSVTNLLSNADSLQEVDEIFAAYMVNKRSKLYGVERPQGFTKALENHAKTWLKKFDADTWTFHKSGGIDQKHSGLQVKSTKMTEIWSFLMSQKSVKKDVEDTLSKALTNLFDRALYTSQDLSFFVPKSVKNQGFETVEINFFLLNTIQEYNKHADNKQEISSHIEKLRNFFLQKAMFATNSKQAFFALRGLKVATKAAPFLHLQKQSGSSLHYQLFDIIGLPVGDISEETSTFKLVANNDFEVDVTDAVTYSSSTGSIHIKLQGKELAPGHYNLQKVASGQISVSEQTFKIEDKITFSKLAFELTKDKDPSDELVKLLKEQVVTNPEKLPHDLKAEDGSFLHVAVPFLSNNHHVYMRLQNVATHEKSNLSVKASGSHLIDVGLYLKYMQKKRDDALEKVEDVLEDAIEEEQESNEAGDKPEYEQIDVITIDFSQQLDQIIGVYDITLLQIAPDGTQASWDLGNINAWFREGIREKNNQGISSEYQLPRAEIVATHPPSEENKHSKKSPFALAATGVLVFLFLFYLSQQCRFANIRLLDFWGFLFVVNLCALMGLILTFWFFYINLIQFLYLLAMYSPVALFLFNRGLKAGSASCKLD